MKKKTQIFHVLLFFFLAHSVLGQNISPINPENLPFATKDSTNLFFEKNLQNDSNYHLTTTNQPDFSERETGLKSDQLDISMNQPYYRYLAPQNLINIRLSPLSSFIEYQHCVSSEKTYRGRFKTRSKYLYAQFGMHPAINFPDGYTIGFKFGETFDHFEMSGGVFWSFGSSYSIVLPSISYGYTTLGLKSKMRFNVGIGFPEILYLGTSYVLD